MTSYDWPSTDIDPDEVFADVAPAMGSQARARAATRPGEHGIPRHRWVETARHIVLGDLTRAEIARRHDITRSAVSQWCKRHAGLIAQVRDTIDREASGIWAYEKVNRLAALQADYEASAEQPDAFSPDHIRVRMALLRQIAEETGQLKSAAFMITPVTHVMVGVDVDQLR